MASRDPMDTGARKFPHDWNQGVGNLEPEEGTGNPEPIPVADQGNGVEKEPEAFRNPLLEAFRLTLGPRAASYGPPWMNFGNIADGWSTIFGADISPRQVALAMIWLKVCRDLQSPSADNLIDIAGYVNCAWMIEEGIEGHSDLPINFRLLQEEEERAWHSETPQP